MRILLTGGGSGGHIIPLLAVAHELKQRAPESELIFVGEKGAKFADLTEGNDLFSARYSISAGKFRRYHGESLLVRILDVKTNLLNIRDAFRTVIGTLQAIRVLRKVKPDIILVKGGFVVVPVGLAAAVLHIPFITHDSDSVPGLANRVIGRWALLHATGMPEEFYTYPKSKVRFVGVPVADEFKPGTAATTTAAKRKLTLPAKARLLLVTGGSQGSQRVNQMVKAVVPRLLDEYPDLHIIHHVGRQNIQLYGTYHHERLRAEAFIDDFATVVTAADVVVTRSGASSIAELGVVGKPAVVIPSPFLANGHQLANARHLAAQGAVVAIDEKTALKNPELLYRHVAQLLNEPQTAARLAQTLHDTTKQDAAAEIAELLLEKMTA